MSLNNREFTDLVMALRAAIQNETVGGSLFCGARGPTPAERPADPETCPWPCPTCVFRRLLPKLEAERQERQGASR